MEPDESIVIAAVASRLEVPVTVVDIFPPEITVVVVAEVIAIRPVLAVRLRAAPSASRVATPDAWISIAPVTATSKPAPATISILSVAVKAIVVPAETSRHLFTDSIMIPTELIPASSLLYTLLASMSLVVTVP